MRVSKEAKRQVIHDLQTFLWQFEQGGYSRETMSYTLAKLEPVLRDDAKMIGGEVGGHLLRMIQDCHFYVEGVGEPKQIVQDLDQLRADLS